MTKRKRQQQSIDYLVRLAAVFPLWRVRRMTGVIRPALEALTKAGIPWSLPRGHRYIKIYGGHLRGSYEHPQKNPRKKGCLVIQTVHGRTLVRVYTVEQALALDAVLPALRELATIEGWA